MMDNFVAVVHHYGLVAVLVGTFFEGEGILVAAGVLAGEGVLQPLGVWAAAACGAWVGHLVWFLIGRHVGRHRWLSRWAWYTRRLAEADRIIQRHPGRSIFILQYLYGTRMIGAAAFGLTHLSLRRFLWYQAANCLIWAALIGAVGYFLGGAGGRIFHGWVRWLWLAVSVLLVIWLLRHLKPAALSTHTGKSISKAPIGGK
jgi:membrane-associated protein